MFWYCDGARCCLGIEHLNKRRLAGTPAVSVEVSTCSGEAQLHRNTRKWEQEKATRSLKPARPFNTFTPQLLFCDNSPQTLNSSNFCIFVNLQFKCWCWPGLHHILGLGFPEIHQPLQEEIVRHLSFKQPAPYFVAMCPFWFGLTSKYP